MLKQEEKEEEESNNEIENKADYDSHYDFDFDFANIFTTASLWLTGGNRPTLYIPIELAKKYKMNRPCRVAFSSHKHGILVSFMCRRNKNNVT